MLEEGGRVCRDRSDGRVDSSVGYQTFMEAMAESRMDITLLKPMLDDP